MVFRRDGSVRQRQQVVELEDGLDWRENLFPSRNFNVNLEGLKTTKMKRGVNHSSSVEEIPMARLDTIGISSDSPESQYLCGANNNNLSRRNSLISQHSCLSGIESVSHHRVPEMYSDFEVGLYVPNKSPSRSNPHKTDNNGNDGSLSKQIDSARRDAVMTLSEKREKKAEIVRRNSERSKEQTIGIFAMTKYSISMSLQKFKETVITVAYSMDLWYGSLKLIEGSFGSGVASYFRFLRWLLLLNLSSLIISVSFLVVPQTLRQFYYNFDEVPDVTKNGGTYLEKSFFDIPDANGTVPPPLTAASLLHRTNPYGVHAEFSITDLFTGEGFLTATTMYYGSYGNQTFQLFEGYRYDLPNAYFFSMFVCYVVILITVSVSMARSYRKTYIETRGTHKGSLALKVFSGWDYSVATVKAASLNQRRIYNEIKEALNEEDFQKRDTSCLLRFTNITVQFTLNFMFFFLMAGIALSMWYLLGRHSAYLSDSTSNSHTMTMAIVTSLVMNILPIGFSWIVRYEDYRNPRTALYVTLLRTFILNIVVIGTTATFWLTHSDECWETALGQEVYRLFITDFIISVLLMGLVETFWSIIRRKFSKISSQPEFNIAWNTLNLIYNQTLFLVGFYFSPLLSVVIVIKLFLTFYIKKAGALYNCQAPKKSWRAAQTQTIFLILTFIALLGVFLVFGYLIVYVSPSKCGPFSGFKYMYEAILSGIFQLHNDNVFFITVLFLAKPGVIGGVLIAMCIATYILRAKAEAYTIEVEILNNMLIQEKKDKAFLFKHIKNTEKASQKMKGSPTLSSSSSFHTPLSARRQLKITTRESQSSFLSTPNRRTHGLQRKFNSTSQIASRSSWRYGRGNIRPDLLTDQPSTSSSSGTSGTKSDTSEMKP
ncbi:transmembrane channel-like protein 5 isoform X2 [Thrips palmi]|uniref:Transmembrane channel-like protein 5 isoform X2 n=1 Tax=Thrips palmi TaxID=161013 RepID=A0A6P8ZVB3_THRPL|nr:transmembrane channel-like protein 5 isoform X2 [Thrips palmi]